MKYWLKRVKKKTNKPEIATNTEQDGNGGLTHEQTVRSEKDYLEEPKPTNRCEMYNTPLEYNNYPLH